MQRYRLTIEYHGAAFKGWQRQPDQPSVQQSIEKALARIGEPDKLVIAAGRTDAGVHALAQIAHVDLERDWTEFRLLSALNHHLKPHLIAIMKVEQVSNEFHARFDAIERSYQYRIINRRAPLVHEYQLAWRVSEKLDIDLMQQGAAHLIGKHDFTTFRSTSCQAQSPVKSLSEITVTRADEIIFVNVRGRSFLHNQVRSIVGTIVKVGCHKWQVDDVKKALEACDRRACGPVAPPDGLYLMSVKY